MKNVTHFEIPVSVWFENDNIDLSYICKGKFYPCGNDLMAVEAEIDEVAFKEIQSNDDYQEDFISYLKKNLNIKINTGKFTLTAKNILNGK